MNPWVPRRLLPTATLSKADLWPAAAMLDADQTARSCVLLSCLIVPPSRPAKSPRHADAATEPVCARSSGRIKNRPGISAWSDAGWHEPQSEPLRSTIPPSALRLVVVIERLLLLRPPHHRVSPSLSLLLVPSFALGLISPISEALLMGAAR